MADYSATTWQSLKTAFAATRVQRPMRIDRYEAGTELTLPVRGVWPDYEATIRVKLGKFVGGGFAGQVYQIEILEIDSPAGDIPGLAVGGPYAMKIMKPPSRFSQWFRDTVYKIGFQSPFQLEVNPQAARSGALWQKFIRRAAALEFKDEGAVNDILVTFVDENLGSCGEISDWVDGRVWTFEVNDHLDAKPEERAALGCSPEFYAKKDFMDRFVKLLHQIGAREFARQYEWWTCKSQPNVLKRHDAGDGPADGLTAVDFRAGLALLPFLPMSPGDFKLILVGLAHGSLVQFDRGSLKKLRVYVEAHPEAFADMHGALDELAVDEEAYRNSQVDVTHNHVRLLTSPKLWKGIIGATRTAWRVRNETDDVTDKKLRSAPMQALLFTLVGMVPMLAKLGALAILVSCFRTSQWGASSIIPMILLFFGLPAVARFGKTLMGRTDMRKHYARMRVDRAYCKRALRAHVIEKTMGYLRAGRMSEATALGMIENPLRYLLHRPLSILPVFLHRMVTDGAWAKGWVTNTLLHPIRLYFNADAREQWLRDMIAEGRRKHMLSEADAEKILSRLDEPFIQKYLKSLAVHVCTLPITQVVSVIVAIWYVAAHPEQSWAQAWGTAGAILVAFQLVPVSPGSLVRGLYVVYLVIRDRSFKDYNIAVFLGFFKYIGYLAFPIQMAYRYPALARFMAGHWATGAVHVVPVFGEHGALMEHGVFNTFYNFPLTVRRRQGELAIIRQDRTPRYWQAALFALLGAGVLAGVDALFGWKAGALPEMSNIWYAVVPMTFLVGFFTARFANGLAAPKRVLLGMAAGVLMGLLYAIFHVGGSYLFLSEPAALGDAGILLLFKAMRRMFFFGVLATLGAGLGESTDRTA